MTKGIDGLYPKNRSDKCESRKLKAEVKELVISLKKANHKRTAKSIYQEIIITTKVKPFELSLSTVQRYIKNLDLSTDSNIKDWSYVNILDTKSQTFLCCTSS